ncbi:sulfatase [Puteibacter caeruleilacunae]|nr:sulfatase [Puteibacter caeruleilacunae]
MAGKSKTVICALAGLTGLLGATIQGVAAKEKPNVLLIMVDDLGYGDLSCYGSEIPTPNLDQLASSGIRFTQFYVGGPVCTPSRFSLLTGCYPQRSQKNLTGAIMPGQDRSLVNEEQTIAEYLKRVDYQTGIIGKWHLGHFSKEALPTHHGFDFFVGHGGGCIDYFEHDYGDLENDWYRNDEFIEEKGYSTHLLTKHAKNYLDTLNQDKPFFLFLSYNAPHYGKTTLKKEDARTLVLKEYESHGVKLMNTLQVPVEDLKKVESIEDIYRRYYAAMVVSVDEAIGQVIKKLKETGEYENTIIWFLSDNGAYSKSYYAHGDNGDLRGEKASLYEGGIRVPSICVWPGKVKSGIEFDGVVGSHDILPTIQHITGFKTDYPVDGVDVTKTLLKQKKVDHQIYWKTGRQKALLKGDMKLVMSGKKKELFDLKKDKEEKNDLSEKYPEQVKALERLWNEVNEGMKQ